MNPVLLGGTHTRSLMGEIFLLSPSIYLLMLIYYLEVILNKYKHIYVNLFDKELMVPNNVFIKKKLNKNTCSLFRQVK